MDVSCVACNQTLVQMYCGWVTMSMFTSLMTRENTGRSFDLAAGVYYTVVLDMDLINKFVSQSRFNLIIRLFMY